MTEESHNPFFRTKRFTPADHKDGIMTANGAAEKSFLLLAIITIVASIVWWGAASGVIAPTVVWILVIVGVIASIIIAITLAFKPQWSPALAPTYAILEGGVLGAISMVFENMYPGIVIQAIALTIGGFPLYHLSLKSGLDRHQATTIVIAYLLYPLILNKALCLATVSLIKKGSTTSPAPLLAG